VALRLLAKVRDGEKGKGLQQEIDRFLFRQNKDGGWSQLKDGVSDAYATGQALYVLSRAGVKRDQDAIRRGIAFLTTTQKEDGSWPMTRRGHPGVTPSANLWPITHFGSAWAMLGLIRSVPN
jgi:squalene cyclase